MKLTRGVDLDVDVKKSPLVWYLRCHLVDVVMQVLRQFAMVLMAGCDVEPIHVVSPIRTVVGVHELFPRRRHGYVLLPVSAPCPKFHGL